MQLTSQTDFAFRILIFLEANPDKTASVTEIAKAYGISYNHLSKIAKKLTVRGYTTMSRGRNGGLKLAQSSSDIRLGQVVRDLEQRLDIVECFNETSNTCVLFPGCRLKTALHKATRSFLEELDKQTLADIVPNPEAMRARWGMTPKT